MRVFLLVAVAVRASLVEAQPIVYWRASPVAAGQATLYAGSFGPKPSVRLCTSPSGCSSWDPIDLLDGWNASVKFALPNCGGPCRFQFCADSETCTNVGDPNAPDVWFAMAHPPLHGSTFSPSTTGSPTVLVNAPHPNSTLRIAGRSLAFQPTGPGGSLQCVFAGSRQGVSSTVLVLNSSLAPIAADDATCYEASFDLSAALAASGALAFPDAVVQTPFGSFPLPITVAPAAPPAPLTVINVDSQAGGNVSAALAQAAALPGYKLVMLGAHSYMLTAPIAVPASTVLAGLGNVSVLSFSIPSGGAAPHAAVSGAGSDWGLRDLSITLVDAPAKTPAVWMPPATSNFTALRLNVTMEQVRAGAVRKKQATAELSSPSHPTPTLAQVNVSSAFRIEGSIFEIADSFLHQAGLCLWPPTSDNTDFTSSVTLYFHGADSGHVRRNTLLWQCSAFDMDGSSRVIFEDNTITCTQAGMIPHGNSISTYDWQNHPASVSYLYAHNTQSRPPHNDPTNWAFHETVTTGTAGHMPSFYLPPPPRTPPLPFVDGPGGWGAGVISAVDGASVTVASGLIAQPDPTGAIAVVVSGPGVGQWRTVISRPSATTLQLSEPLDTNVILDQSILAVIAQSGGKIIVDNHFSWGSEPGWDNKTLTILPVTVSALCLQWLSSSSARR